MQTIERTNVFLKIYDIFWFLYFLYLWPTIQQIFYYLNPFRIFLEYFNIIFSFFLYSLQGNKFVYSNKLLIFNMKSINSIQKYLHIIELYACILQIFVIIFLFRMNFLISFEICN